MGTLNRNLLTAASLLAFCAAFPANAAPNPDFSDTPAAPTRHVHDDQSAQSSASAAATAASAAKPDDMERREQLAYHDSLYLDDDGRKLIYDNEYGGGGASKSAFESDLFEEIEIWDATFDSQGLEYVEEIGQLGLKNLKKLRIGLNTQPADCEVYVQLLKDLPGLTVEIYIRGEENKILHSFTVGMPNIKPAAAAEGRMKSKDADANTSESEQE